MKFYFIVLLLLLPGIGFGQKKEGAKKARTRKIATFKGADPYKGKPFKAGDVKTLRLGIPVGKLMISNDITYKLQPDEFGRAYIANHTYRAYIIKVTPVKGATPMPKNLTDGFLYRVADLTEKQVMSDQVIAPEMDYFYKVADFNLDGKPDFAFTGDKRYHPYPLKNYVWVNMNDKLVYWYGLSNVPSDKENASTRMLSIIVNNKKGSPIPMYYHVAKDTTLVPVKE